MAHSHIIIYKNGNDASNPSDQSNEEKIYIDSFMQLNEKAYVLSLKGEIFEVKYKEDSPFKLFLNETSITLSELLDNGKEISVDEAISISKA